MIEFIFLFAFPWLCGAFSVGYVWSAENESNAGVIVSIIGILMFGAVGALAHLVLVHPL